MHEELSVVGSQVGILSSGLSELKTTSSNNILPILSHNVVAHMATLCEEKSYSIVQTTNQQGAQSQRPSTRYGGKGHSSGDVMKMT